MKLNFWQWIGLLLLIAGVALWLYERNLEKESNLAPPSNVPAPTTQA